MDRFEAEALKMPREARARLAASLIASLDKDNEIERAWEAEAESRYQRYLDGKEEALPSETALGELRTELGH